MKDKLKNAIKSLKNNKLFTILFIAIILLEIGVRVYVGFQKEYFHVDELYSYGLMNADRAFLVSSPDLDNNWHSSQYFKDYLVVNKQEVAHLSTVYYNQIKNVHPPVYYTLLRIMATFTGENFSKWTGIILNILISIGSLILVYLITKKLFYGKTWYGLLAMLYFALCPLAIQSSIFIGMYELFAFNVLLLVYIHIIWFYSKNIKWINMIFTTCIIVIGVLTHYYYIIFVALLNITYLIKYIIKKEYKNAIKYTVIIICAALIASILFPYMYSHIFNGYRGKEALSNLGEIGNFLTNFKGYLCSIDTDIFNLTLPLILIIIIICIIIYSSIKIKKKQKIVRYLLDEEKLLLTLSIPVILYIIVIDKIASEVDNRYIMCISSLISIQTLVSLRKYLNLVIVNTVKLYQVVAGIVIVISILTLPKINSFPYTYKGSNNKLENLQGKEELPCVYIYGSSDYGILYNIIPLIKIKETYTLREENYSEENITKALENKDLKNGILVFNTVEVNDSYKHINDIKNIYGFNNEEKLFNLGTDDLYYLY